MMIPIVINTLETIPKRLVQGLEHLEGKKNKRTSEDNPDYSTIKDLWEYWEQSWRL